jgi:hypothetical protein
MLIINASPSSSTAILSPQACAVQLASKLNFWYSADNLVVIDGLIAGATDLTGNDRNGVQNTNSLRLTYFASDSLFGGKPSFGSLNSAGNRRLICNASLPYRHQIFSTYYANGTESLFPSFNCISSGTAPGGTPRIRSNSNAATLNTNQAFTSSLSQGGRAQSNTILPMPASVYTATSASAVSTTLAIGSNQAVLDQTWLGAFRHFVGANQLLTPQEIALIEGVIAWNDGTQNTLISTHPYFSTPPT